MQGVVSLSPPKTLNVIHPRLRSPSAGHLGWLLLPRIPTTSPIPVQHPPPPPPPPSLSPILLPCGGASLYDIHYSIYARTSCQGDLLSQNPGLLKPNLTPNHHPIRPYKRTATLKRLLEICLFHKRKIKSCDRSMNTPLLQSRHQIVHVNVTSKLRKINC